MIMKDFNANAYAVVIHTRDLAERAFALYHAASRDESTSYEVARFQDDLQEVAKAFDTFKQTQEGEE
jgi:hypothetical protein